MRLPGVVDSCDDQTAGIFAEVQLPLDAELRIQLLAVLMLASLVLQFDFLVGSTPPATRRAPRPCRLVTMAA